MRGDIKKLILKTAALLVAAVFFQSCWNEDEDVISGKKPYEVIPAGVAENMRLVYTDSAKVKAVLTAPEYKDYSNIYFRHSEFPKGLQVEFYDEEGHKNTLVADYGILYNLTNIIDLRGNVFLKTYDGKTLKSSQLYWDQKEEWLFTEKKFTFTSPDMNLEAMRLDSNRDFTRVSAGRPIGEVATEEK